jgi:hypothetical protein
MDRAVWLSAVAMTAVSKMSPRLARWLRSYGVQKILERVAAILVSRPGGHQLPVAEHKDYDDAVLGWCGTNSG